MQKHDLSTGVHPVGKTEFDFTINNKIDIKTSISDAFDFYATIDNYPLYNHLLVSYKVIKSETVGTVTTSDIDIVENAYVIGIKTQQKKYN